MKKLLSTLLAFSLLFCLSACSTSQSSQETEKTDTSVASNTNDILFKFENPYFTITFLEQEVDGQETIIYYTVENLSEKEVYVKYHGWKQAAELADPTKKAHVFIDRSDSESDGFGVTLWSSTAEEAQKEDQLGHWIFEYTFDDVGNITDITSINWMFDGQNENNAHDSGNNDTVHPIYEFICDNPDIIINEANKVYEEDGFIVITVNCTNNTKYAVRDLEPGETKSFSVFSKEKCTLDSLEVGDKVEMDFPVWTLAGSDGKGGGESVDTHAYIVRTK